MIDFPPPKRLFRAMKRASDGKPLCGSLANELGVRPGVDISADSAGQVRPATGGLSTTPDDPSFLPPHVRPANLGGRGKLPVFVLDVADMDQELVACRDPKNPRKHAFIEPSIAMFLTTFQERLCRGRSNWREV
jgi:hypothetical protein